MIALPHDAGVTLSALRFLASPPAAPLWEQAAAASNQAAAIERLRKQFPHEAVRAALVMAPLQAKALGPGGKFRTLVSAGIWPAALPFFALPEALEQATSLAVARLKASRFAALGRDIAVLDLGCGMGGDALALAEKFPTLAFDLSLVRLFCLSRNAQALNLVPGLRTVAADVITRPWKPARNTVFHLDPARRSQGRRSHRYENLIPGPSFIQSLLQHSPTGAIKLSSAVEFNQLPAGHLEVISEGGIAVQAVLWTGELADLMGPYPRRATVVNRHGIAWTLSGNEAFCEPGPAQRHLFEIDAAVTRAGLAHFLAQTLDLTPLTRDGGYQSGAQIIHHPALTGFAVQAVFPWHEKRVTAYLRENPHPGPPQVEVKSRGGLDLNVDRLQVQWSRVVREKGSGGCTVLIYRNNAGMKAVIAHRHAADVEPPPVKSR